MNILVKVHNDDLAVKETYVMIEGAPDKSTSVIEAMIGEAYAQVYGEDSRYSNGYWEPVARRPHDSAAITIYFNEAAVDDYEAESGYEDADY